MIWLIFLLLPSLVPLAVPLSTSLHCLNLSHPLVPHFSFFPPNSFSWLSGGARRAWLQYVSWTNRGHISLAGNTILLWKCSVNYWARNKHPLCHFWLSYLCWANGSNARLLSSRWCLICISWRNTGICLRTASLLELRRVCLHESFSPANQTSPREFFQPLANREG